MKHEKLVKVYYLESPHTFAQLDRDTRIGLSSENRSLSGSRNKVDQSRISFTYCVSTESVSVREGDKKAENEKEKEVLSESISGECCVREHEKRIQQTALLVVAEGLRQF